MKNAFLHSLDSSDSEVIFAPFHDPALASQMPLEFTPEASGNATIDFQWSWTRLAWNDCLPGESACSVSCQVFQPLNGFDEFVVCFSAAPEISCRFSADFGKGHRPISDKIPGCSFRDEQVIPFPRETGPVDFLHYFTVEIFCKNSGPNQMTLSWFGLRDGQRYRLMHNHRIVREPDQWATFLKPRSQWDEPRFAKGLLFSEQELPALREKIRRPGWKEHFAILVEQAEQFLQRVPEADLGAYLPTSDQRYIRDTERNRRPYHWEAQVLAFVGLVKCDSEMIQQALRYLMCMASTPNWTESAEHRVPTSTWDARCFLEEMTSTSVATLMDWLDFALKPATREWLWQVLWDRGIAYVQRNLMKHSYMHAMNQGAVFSRACILGGLILEDHWDLDGFVDRSYHKLQQILKNHIQPDGSFHEGPAYFCQLMQGTIPAIVAYHRFRDKEGKQVIQDCFGRSLPFIEAISAGARGTFVPWGDCRTEWFCGDGVPILASLYPDSFIAGILGDCLRQGSIYSVTGTLSNSGGLLGMVLGPKHVRSCRRHRQELTFLPDCGLLSCNRKAEDNGISIMFCGSGKHGTHSHQDIGSFVLEAKSVPILVDPGMVEYHWIHTLDMSCSDMHNVLTPVLDDGSFPSHQSSDKEEHFSYQYTSPALTVWMSLSQIWRKYFKEYQRCFSSAKPNELIIEDKGQRLESGLIAFHLQTPHAVRFDNGEVTVIFPGGCCIIAADWAAKKKIDKKGVDLHYQPLNHIIFYSAAVTSFDLRTQIEVHIDSTV